MRACTRILERTDSTLHGFSRIGIRMILPCRGARMLQPKTPINSAHSSWNASTKLEEQYSQIHGSLHRWLQGWMLIWNQVFCYRGMRIEPRTCALVMAFATCSVCHCLLKLFWLTRTCVDTSPESNCPTFWTTRSSSFLSESGCTRCMTSFIRNGMPVLLKVKLTIFLFLSRCGMDLDTWYTRWRSTVDPGFFLRVAGDICS